MDIAQMRMILALAESKSMTTTAKKLRVTQPALTYQLKVIEKELGFKVFNRTRTGTSLTPEGAFLHERIREILQSYDDTVRLARAMAKGTAAGTIRVGVNDYSRDTISFILNVAQSSALFTLIPCGSSDPVKLLREGVIDFWSTSDAVLARCPDDLRFAELSTAGQSVFVPVDHHLSTRDAVSVSELKSETVWLWPRNTASRAADMVRDELESLGADVVDFVPGVSPIVTAFMDQGIVVYDEGFLPPSNHSAKQLQLADGEDDSLGLAYLAANEKRLFPILEDLKEHIPSNQGRIASKTELAAERIITVLDEISSTVRRGGMKDIVPLVEYALELGISAYHIMNRALLPGMNATGDAFSKGEIYTSEMMAAVSTTNLAMEVLQPRFAIEDERPLSGTAAIGTVPGDLHDIGKNLVRIMLESRDIEVADLGKQVSPEAFVQHVRDNPNCNLILVSVSSDELLENAHDVVRAFEKAKLRDQIFIMVGGAAATQEFADEIAADAYTANAEDAAQNAYDFLSL